MMIVMSADVLNRPTQPRTGTPRHLTADTIAKIDAAIERVVAEAGFGSVTLVIDRGKLKWIQPGPSLPIS